MTSSYDKSEGGSDGGPVVDFPKILENLGTVHDDDHFLLKHTSSRSLCGGVVHRILPGDS